MKDNRAFWLLLITFLALIMFAAATRAADTIRIDSDDGDSFAIVSTNVVKIGGDGFPDDIFGAKVSVFSAKNDGNDKPFGTGFYSVQASRCTGSGGMVVLDDDFNRLTAAHYDLTDHSDTWVTRVVRFLCSKIPQA